MSLVNQVPKIVPEDFQTMLNSNINVSALPGLLGACASARTRVKGVGEVAWRGQRRRGSTFGPLAVQAVRKRAQVLRDSPPAFSLLPIARMYQRWDGVLRRFLSVFLLLSVSLSHLSFAQDCLTLSVHHTAGQAFCLLYPAPHSSWIPSLLGPVDGDISGQPHTVTNCPQ